MAYVTFSYFTVLYAVLKALYFSAKTWFHFLKYLNPFMPNVFSYPYQLDKSISNLRVGGWYFSFFIQIKKKLL